MNYIETVIYSEVANDKLYKLYSEESYSAVNNCVFVKTIFYNESKDKFQELITNCKHTGGSVNTIELFYEEFTADKLIEIAKKWEEFNNQNYKENYSKYIKEIDKYNHRKPYQKVNQIVKILSGKHKNKIGKVVEVINDKYNTPDINYKSIVSIDKRKTSNNALYIVNDKESFWINESKVEVIIGFDYLMPEYKCKTYNEIDKFIDLIKSNTTLKYNMW